MSIQRVESDDDSMRNDFGFFYLFFSLFLSRKRSLSLSRFFLLFFCKGVKGSEINTGLDHKKKGEERLSTLI